MQMNILNIVLLTLFVISYVQICMILVDLSTECHKCAYLFKIWQCNNTLIMFNTVLITGAVSTECFSTHHNLLKMH